MYVNLDVHIWLECRKNTGRPDLRRIGNYVLASSTDRREFEKFRESEFYKQRPLIKTHLLEQFMKQKSIAIEYFHKFDIDFIMSFPKSQFDDLCTWARNILYGDNQASEQVVDHEQSKGDFISYIVVMVLNILRDRGNSKRKYSAQEE